MKNSVKATFTRRERQVADLLARGLSEKEIADRLFVSQYTINNHTRNIRNKFGLKKNSEIILRYIAEINSKDFALDDIRKHGISIILT